MNPEMRPGTNQQSTRDSRPAADTSPVYPNGGEGSPLDSAFSGARDIANLEISQRGRRSSAPAGASPGDGENRMQTISVSTEEAMAVSIPEKTVYALWKERNGKLWTEWKEEKAEQFKQLPVIKQAILAGTMAYEIGYDVTRPVRDAIGTLAGFASSIFFGLGGVINGNTEAVEAQWAGDDYSAKEKATRLKKVQEDEDAKRRYYKEREVQEAQTRSPEEEERRRLRRQQPATQGDIDDLRDENRRENAITRENSEVAISESTRTKNYARGMVDYNKY